jgi:dipeptidyl aminopeptidase/acylaminoacyl peptidase
MIRPRSPEKPFGSGFRGERRAALCALLFCFSFPLIAKRPITHADYADWRSIASPSLSRDGRLAAWAVFPQEGNGELVVRDTHTDKEWRAAIGQQPPPPRADPFSETPPRPRTITLAFVNRGKAVVFTTFPSREEIEKARRERKTAPKNGLGILDLATGAIVHVDNVRGFAAPEFAGSFFVYSKEPGEKQKAGDLVLRAFDGSERILAQTAVYSLSKDGRTLAYATDSAVEDLEPGVPLPKEIQTGRARYSKLTWSDDQKRLAFAGTPDKSPATIFVWNRGSAHAQVAANETTPGFEKDYVPSDNGALSFSKDGQWLFFGCAIRAAAIPKDDGAEVANFDLWNYKDDSIQPMQHARARQDLARTFRAVWRANSGKVVQLGDVALGQTIAAEHSRWALGIDDRAYRISAEYGEHFSDTWAVDTETGERRLIAQRYSGRPLLAPDGAHALLFNGADWEAISLVDGAKVNLTARRGVKFSNEENDTPAAPAPYGAAGWTSDSRSVLLYDRFDIWLMAADGSGAEALTKSEGRKNGIEFRYVKRDENEKSVDPSKPLLLRAENLSTHESGFYRTDLNAGGPPSKLIWGAKDYRVAVTAKDANALMFTASTFREFPDLQLTDRDFHDPHRISNANPRQEELLWGDAEMIHFRNTDGVSLSGVLYKPENFDPGKKYPMLVYIYEKLSQNVNHFVDPRPGHSINVSYYVSNGYLVFTPDIVYTVGYPGQSALKCVLPGVQAVVDRGYVDGSRIGIQGHSWGGYQVAYMITQTDRFRAVEAGAPVANMTSAYDGIRWGPGLPRQFQYEKTQSRIGGSLWEYPMRFIENSPVFFADRVKTPVMILSNDADDAVPWYQGIEFFLALRRLGREAYLFNYHGEPHHLEKRVNQKDYTARMQEFFDYYLKDAPKPAWMDRGIPYLDTAQSRAQRPAPAVDEQP